MTIHYDEKGKFFTDVITKDSVPSIIQTLTHRIEGCIHVRQDQRTKEALDKADDFVAITDAKVLNRRGEILYETHFIAINREHIVWMVPIHELAGSEVSDREGTGESEGENE